MDHGIKHARVFASAVPQARRRNRIKCRMRSAFFMMLCFAAIMLFSGCEDILFLKDLKEIAGIGSGRMVVRFNENEIKRGDPAIDHGWVVTGIPMPQYLDFYIENAGIKELDNCTVFIEPESPDYSISQPPYMLSIPSGQTDYFQLRFSPGTGDKSATVRITSSDPSGDFTFKLKGRGVGWVAASPVNATAALDIAVRGDYAYIASDASGISIMDIRDPTNPVWINNITPPGTFATSVAIYDRYLLAGYVLSAPPSPVEFFMKWDIGVHPEAPAFAGSLTSEDLPDGVTDIAVKNDYAYAVSQHFELYIIDVSPATPQKRATYEHSDNTALGSGVAVSGNFAYATFTGMNAPMNRVAIVDISTPASPQGVSEATLTDSGNKIGLYGSHVYVTTFTGGSELIDASDPYSPQPCSPFGTSMGSGILVSYPYAYIGGVASFGIQLVDISTPDAPYEIPSGFMNCANNGSEVTGIAKKGDYLFATSLEGFMHVFFAPK
jgi:hypothetical protein